MTTDGRWARFCAIVFAGGTAIASLGLASPSQPTTVAGPVALRATPLADAAFAELERRNFEVYRRNVEPIFSRPRGYPDSGESAACVMCHTWQTSLRFHLQPMTETADGWAWTPAQSTLNYEAVTQLVNASDPASR